MNTIIIENLDFNSNSSVGSVSYVHHLVDYLVTMNHEVTLLGCGFGKNNPLTPNIKSVSISKKRLSNLKFLLRLFFLNINQFYNDKFIIHAQRTDFLLPFIIFPNKHYKTICTLHGVRDFAFARKKGKILGFVYLKLMQYTFKKIDFIISVDKDTLQRYVAYDKELMYKSCVIPVGVDFKTFIPMDKNKCKEQLHTKYSKIVLYIGRLESEKNVFFILNVARMLIKQDITFLIVGGGRQAESLKTYAKVHKITNVCFEGEVEYSKIPVYINASNLMVLTSDFEGSPTVVRESLACNVPVLSFDVGDVREILDQFGDEYIAERNEEIFATQIVKLLNAKHPDFRAKLAEYNSETMGQKTLEIYSKVYET